MKRKATFYLEHGLLRAMRAGAARSGKPESQVLEEALRAYLGLELLEHVGALTPGRSGSLGRWLTRSATASRSDPASRSPGLLELTARAERTARAATPRPGLVGRTAPAGVVRTTTGLRHEKPSMHVTPLVRGRNDAFSKVMCSRRVRATELQRDRTASAMPAAAALITAQQRGSTAMRIQLRCQIVQGSTAT